MISTRIKERKGREGSASARARERANERGSEGEKAIGVVANLIDFRGGRAVISCKDGSSRSMLPNDGSNEIQPCARLDGESPLLGGLDRRE